MAASGRAIRSATWGVLGWIVARQIYRWGVKDGKRSVEQVDHAKIGKAYLQGVWIGEFMARNRPAGRPTP